MTRIGVTGAAGRMGRMLIETIINDKDCEITAALEQSSSGLLGVDVGELCGLTPQGVNLKDDLESVIDEIDVLIDFSVPSATSYHSQVCAQAQKAIVIGTTGFTVEQKDTMLSLSSETRICISTNYSVGVNLCFKLLEQATKVMGNDADIEIVEMHHRHKVDAPSGTALSMGETISETLGKDLSDIAEYHREGQTGPRKSGVIGFATLRGGDVIGDHSAIFAVDGERVEISHKASSRMAFATGAVRAAKWLSVQKNGLYDMQDVLGFR
jgi:4-hydroxy-tetrahydrodipicolinate reductase